MKLRQLTITGLTVFLTLFSPAASWCTAASDQTPSIDDVTQRLLSGHRTRIVCFGDSITGAYYHTGSQRAWCDMLGNALQKLYPKASLQMINAGISGHTTVNALARIERDVIAKNPHLVVVKFGMNDVTRVPPDTFEANVRNIVRQCHAAGAAVVLCTPNGVAPNTARPEDKLSRYAEAVRVVAKSERLILVDLLKDWQRFREQDPVGWSLVMSDEIHPNMNGHIRFAEQIAESISGRAVSLDNTPPPFDALQHTFDRLSRNETVKIVAMAPYDRIITTQLQRHFPDADFEVTVWPTANSTVSEMKNWAKRIRGLQPHLVIPAVPLKALDVPQEIFIPDYEWILNLSFQFAGRPWDVVPALPAAGGDATEKQQANLQHARRIAMGKDVRFIERTDVDDKRSVENIIGDWVTEQMRVWRGARNILPAKNGSVLVPTQPWPHRPGPRCIRVALYYPGGQQSGVNEQTGIMLTLHNWGGRGAGGSASPNALADRLNVVAVAVDYLQSGRADSVAAPEPYDYGCLQAIDALRALGFVRRGLKQSDIPYDDHRIFCTGGSGGGNVTLMANKFAPRTFACVIDMCGMKKLSDDIAFHLPGGSGLNARWSQDPESVNYLSADEQEIRFVGNPQHLAVMKSLDHRCRIITVHGQNDRTCPFEDAQEMVTNLKAAGLDVVSHFIGQDDVDGSIFTSSGHPLGNRTEIVFRVAGTWLSPESPETIRRIGPSDFDRQQDVVYRTTNGKYVISFDSGIPVAAFRPVATGGTEPRRDPTNAGPSVTQMNPRPPQFSKNVPSTVRFSCHDVCHDCFPRRTATKRRLRRQRR